MPPTLHIRPATPADLPAVADLAAMAWRAHYPGIITAAQIDYMLAWMYSLPTLTRELTREAVAYDLLFLDDRLIGFAAYGPAGTPPASECKLHKLYLHPAFLRRGHGTALLGHVCGVAARNFKTLILSVNKRNTTAIAAYQKNGFAIREAVCHDIGQGFVMDDYIMAKPLDPASASL